MLVMGGNPFDHTIIIDDGNGVRTVPVLRTRECSQCGEMCKGGSGCLRPVMLNPPPKYLFFATDDHKRADNTGCICRALHICRNKRPVWTDGRPNGRRGWLNLGVTWISGLGTPSLYG